MAAGPAFNVSDLIDTRPLGALQVRIVILCTLVALLDGLDLQSIGLAAPGIAADLHIPLPRLSAVFSAALAGLALGAFGFGVLADRVGRKAVLIAATACFGIFTICTALAPSARVPLSRRPRARRRHAEFHQPHVGILPAPAARGDRGAALGGLSARRFCQRAPGLLDHSGLWLAFRLLGRRRAAAARLHRPHLRAAGVGRLSGRERSAGRAHSVSAAADVPVGVRSGGRDLRPQRRARARRAGRASSSPPAAPSAPCFFGSAFSSPS